MHHRSRCPSFCEIRPDATFRVTAVVINLRTRTPSRAPFDGSAKVDKMNPGLSLLHPARRGAEARTHLQKRGMEGMQRDSRERRTKKPRDGTYSTFADRSISIFDWPRIGSNVRVPTCLDNPSCGGSTTRPQISRTQPRCHPTVGAIKPPTPLFSVSPYHLRRSLLILRAPRLDTGKMGSVLPRFV